jgi:hypothetical protein
MRTSDVLAMLVSAVFGFITGVLIAGWIGGAVGAGLGIAFAFGAARANVRPVITMTVFVGAMTGVLIGSSIMQTICLPNTCVALEATGGVVIGLASLVGVGLVAALVTRSFDEYNEKIEAGQPPPTVGCETEPDPSGPAG